MWVEDNYLEEYWCNLNGDDRIVLSRMNCTILDGNKRHLGNETIYILLEQETRLYSLLDLDQYI